MKDKIAILKNITDCLDIYEKKLYIRDEDIPSPFVLLKEVGGIITDVKSWIAKVSITISDHSGNDSLINIDSRKYMDNVIKVERENSGYIYFDVFITKYRWFEVLAQFIQNIIRYFNIINPIQLHNKEDFNASREYLILEKPLILSLLKIKYKEVNRWII